MPFPGPTTARALGVDTSAITNSRESRDTTVSKEVVYAILGLLVVIIAILIATGKVQIFPAG